jgi:hypothetical protein
VLPSAKYGEQFVFIKIYACDGVSSLSPSTIIQSLSYRMCTRSNDVRKKGIWKVWDRIFVINWQPATIHPLVFVVVVSC